MQLFLYSVQIKINRLVVYSGMPANTNSTVPSESHLHHRTRNLQFEVSQHTVNGGMPASTQKKTSPRVALL